MHRNSQKRIIESGKIYFITTTTHERFPYFQNEILAWLFVAELRLCKLLKKFDLYAFCILYDHVHLLIKPLNTKNNISKIMRFVKRNLSRDANFIMGYNEYDYERNLRVSEGDNHDCRLLRDKFEKELLCKMYKYILALRFKFQSLPKSKKIEIPIFKWQKSYHDHLNRNEKNFEMHYEYTVQNFKKHNDNEDRRYQYSEDYKFTPESFPRVINNYFENSSKSNLS